MRLFTLCLLFCTSFLIAQKSSFQTELQAALDQQQYSLSQEKLYLQTDRPLYYPGDVVWLSAYLVGSDNTTSTTQSDIVHVELLRPNGSLLKKVHLTRNQGALTADLQLPNNLAGGTYTLRAFTNYQGNFGERYLYEKTIQVQRSVVPQLLLKLEVERESYAPGETVNAFFSARNLKDAPLKQTTLEYYLQIGGQAQAKHTIQTNDVGTANLSLALPADLSTQDVQLTVMLKHRGQQEQISRPVGITLNNIAVKFLPEGGEWVQGLSVRMAFIAKDEFDEPADVSGTVYDALDQPILQFSSMHDGMGNFDLPADVKTPCRVRLDQPVGGQRVYPLPDPITGAWQLRADYNTQDELVLQADALAEDNLQIAIRSNGQLRDCLMWQLQKGQQELSVDVSGLPMGIAQITVFDEELRPVWERLVFLHPQRQLQVDISTDKKKYSYREEVKMEVKVKDQNGRPVQGMFSLAVSDDRLHSFIDDKQPNILAQLLLSSELSGKIHEPNFYFDQKETDALAALDLLMLTHGWRRFHWRTLLQQDHKDWQAMRQFEPEAVKLRGQLSWAGELVCNKKIRIHGNEVFKVSTDDHGNFFVSPDIMSSERLIVEYQGFKKEAALYHDQPALVENPFNPAVIADRLEDIILTEAAPEAPENLVEFSEEPVFAEVQADDPHFGISTTLDEVTVVASGVSRQSKLTGASMSVLNNWANNTLHNNGLMMRMDLEDAIPELHVYSAPNSAAITVREFAFPDYSNSRIQNRREVDQRKTIYWNGHLATDTRGIAKVNFFTADESTTYRAIFEGMGSTSSPAHEQHTFSATPALSIDAQLPTYATTGDTILATIRLENNSRSALEIPLLAQFSEEGLEWLQAVPEQINIAAAGYEVLQVPLLVTAQSGEVDLTLTAGENGTQVSSQHHLDIHPTGFPKRASASDQKLQARYDLNIDAPITGTLRGELSVFPDLSGELLAGVDAILQEPHGCFEQTSSSNYPNIMVLQYLQQQDQLDEETRTKAWSLLERGYDRLSGYEVSTGGFSLWGQPPAVPVLTAFGLLQFSDLQQVWPKVDPELVPRTVDWLSESIKQFNTVDVNQAYILYALSRCSDYRSTAALEELNTAAQTQSIAYLTAIAARLNLLYGERALAKEQIEELIAIFHESGFQKERQSPSFVHSIGNTLAVELMAWTILAAIEYDFLAFDLQPIMDKLLTFRHGGGRFGPTQPTVMALKAIVAFEQASARPRENGKILVSINQHTADTLHYSPANRGQLKLTGLEEYLQAGRNSIEVRFVGATQALPYTLDVYWQTAELPQYEEAAPLAFQAQLATSSLKLSEQVRYEVELENLQAEAGYAPMIQLALPAGLQWQNWQMEQMVERGLVDYYEIHGPYLVLYFAEIAPRELKQLNFDLVAVAPGYYQAPAANAYLYYRDHIKQWLPGTAVHILP
ncbi:MAG: MG2 domain-containing protein [Bacteroidota bacterium]